MKSLAIDFIPWDFGPQHYQFPDTPECAWNFMLTQKLIQDALEPGFKPEPKDFYWFMLVYTVVRCVHPDAITSDDSIRGTHSLEELKAFVVGTFNKNYSHEIFEALPAVADIVDFFDLVENAGEATSAAMMGLDFNKLSDEALKEASDGQRTLTWNEIADSNGFERKSISAKKNSVKLEFCQNDQSIKYFKGTEHTIDWKDLLK